MTVMATTPGYRRYLIRRADTSMQLFTVEATDKEQAMTRAMLVAEAMSLDSDATTLVIEECSAVVQVPNFLEGYYAMLDRMA